MKRLRLPLVLFFLAGSLAAKDPFALAVDVGLVLESDAGQMAEDVFLFEKEVLVACSGVKDIDWAFWGSRTNHLSIGTASSCSAKIIKGLDAGEQVVDNGHDDDNAD